MPGPVLPGTLPDTFNAWVQLLQTQGFDIQQISELGITTIDGLKNWVAQQGYQIIPITQQVEQTVGYTFAKISPADAANTDLQSMEVVYEVAKVAGGQALSEVISGRNKIIGAVSKFVAVGACLSLLVESIGSFLVPDKIQKDLISSVDPYTIDGENVPVLIDENGKTHFLDEMVEAVRQKAIELGLWSGDKEGIDIIEPQWNDIIKPFYKFTPRYTSITYGGTTYNGYLCDRYLIEVIERNSSNEIIRDEIYNYILIEPRNPYGELSDIDVAMYITPYGSEKLWKNIRLNIVSSDFTNTGSSGRHCYYRSFYYDKLNNRWGGVDDETYMGNIELTYNNVTKYGTYHDHPTKIEYEPGRRITTIIHDTLQGVQQPDVSTINTQGMYAIAFGTFDEAGGISGITPAQDLIIAGVADATKPLTEVLPQLAQGQLSIASPTENDLTHKSNWYPVSINSEDVFTDGVTEEETSTATDGDVKEDLQPAILDAINELIKQLNPDGIPDIPVSDSGDTPPDNPPLIPPSDVTGSNGLWSIYNPSLQNVNDFGAWLWSDSLADQFKRIFNSPIDGVIGFHVLYCTPTTGTAKPIKCGFLQSPVSAPVVTNPYVEINCGTVSINEYYRNAMDYDNTRISVYLPFIGIVPLDTNIVMGSDINITYRIDVLTGTCLAQIKVLKENSDAVMYAFDGNCAVQIPLTATTYTGMIGALLGGISAGASIMTGNMVQAIGSGMRALASGMTGLSGAKQSGTFGANVGALGIRIPYVIITHPVSAMPDQFNKLEGIPSNNAVILGSLSGYTRVRSVHLENIGKATQEEIQMIQEQLESGVII